MYRSDDVDVSVEFFNGISYPNRSEFSCEIFMMMREQNMVFFE